MSLLIVAEYTLEVHGRTLLEHIGLSVNRGETVGLVGESGSGKSVTARAVIGLIPEASRIHGTIDLDGVDMAGADTRVLQAQRRSSVSMVFQDPRSGINPVRTVGDFLTETLRHCNGWSKRKAFARAEELLGSVGLPHPRSHLAQYPHEFSGGMLQRIMIAAALASEPSLLLCDEVTTALDVTTQAEIIDLLLREKEARNMGMLFITHDLNLAASLCDRVYIMRAGVVVESGVTAEVFARPQNEYTRMLVAATPSITASIPASAPRAAVSSVILRASDVRKSYATKSGDVIALDGVSFELERGTALGLVGESGSGKSTLARILVGLEIPDSGRIEIDGDPIPPARTTRERLALARKRQIVFQDPYLSLDRRKTVGDAIADPLRLHFGLRGDAARKRVAELLQSVGLSPSTADARPRTLSGGQRQRVAIAKALAVSPEILVLDEATSALDVSVQAQVLEVLATLKQEHGQSMVFVSHNLAVVRQVCDQAIVMHQGRVVESGTPDRILTAPQEEYTRLLVSAIPLERVVSCGIALAPDRFA
jgi:peptide/nickel transport system ATP-binding protein